MSARSRRPPRRALLVILAACAVLGIGAVATTAAWTARVDFELDAEVAGFNMEYSYDTNVWEAFPSGGTVTPPHWDTTIQPGDAKKIHSVFIRNTVSSATTVTFAPDVTGVFADVAGFLTIETSLNVPSAVKTTWVGQPIDVRITSGNNARIDLTFEPNVLEAAETVREGTVSVTVTGTVGEEAAPTGAPARADAADRVVAAPIGVALRRSDCS